MVTQQDLENLAEEIFKLIEEKGIPVEVYDIGIRISREEYGRLKEGLAGTKADLGDLFALATRKWSIKVSFPFLEVKPLENQEESAAGTGGCKCPVASLGNEPRWKKGAFVRTNVPHLIEKVCYTGNESRLWSVRQPMQGVGLTPP
jgi:hypothetical protein